MRFRFALLALLVSLAGCGELPQPFLGNPGGAAKQLSKPPAPRLVVMPPDPGVLGDAAASHAFAADLASDLQAAQVPAYAERPAPTDWRLVVTARQSGAAVIPTYLVLDPRGEAHGTVTGEPVPVGAWADGSPAALKAAARYAAPKLADLLNGVETALMRADPNSLYNRPARVVVTGVAGAPGDGDASLAREMRLQLKKLGEVVQDTPKDADFTVRCEVRVVPIPNHQQRVEVQWIVDTASGREGGRVVQLHDIPAGSLNGYWGDVAAVVAQQAAGGVREVILRQSRRE